MSDIETVLILLLFLFFCVVCLCFTLLSRIGAYQAWYLEEVIKRSRAESDVLRLLEIGNPPYSDSGLDLWEEIEGRYSVLDNEDWTDDEGYGEETWN